MSSVPHSVMRVRLSNSASMKFARLPLIVLDDFGTQNATEWAREKLFQILNHRYTNRLSVVITTNLALEEIEARLRSRILDPSLVDRDLHPRARLPYTDENNLAGTSYPRWICITIRPLIASDCARERSFLSSSSGRSKMRSMLHRCLPRNPLAG